MLREIDARKMEQYRAAARRREADRETTRERRRERALAVARQAAHLLRNEFGADRVTLFGSACHERRFFERSDVDLAVWGLPEERYLRAVSRLLSLDPEVSVDLVRVEEAGESLRTVIDDEGVPL